MTGVHSEVYRDQQGFADQDKCSPVLRVQVSMLKLRAIFRALLTSGSVHFHCVQVSMLKLRAIFKVLLTSGSVHFHCVQVSMLKLRAIFKALLTSGSVHFHCVQVFMLNEVHMDWLGIAHQC